MKGNEVENVEAVLAEVGKATAKFPTWPLDPLHAVAVLGEEFGELTKAVLQHTYEPDKASLDDVREEAIQTAAMAMRFLASLDVYEYRRSTQHYQKPPAQQVADARSQWVAVSDRLPEPNIDCWISYYDDIENCPRVSRAFRAKSGPWVWDETGVDVGWNVLAWQLYIEPPPYQQPNDAQGGNE